MRKGDKCTLMLKGIRGYNLVINIYVMNKYNYGHACAEQ